MKRENQKNRGKLLERGWIDKWVVQNSSKIRKLDIFLGIFDTIFIFVNIRRF